MPAIFEDGNAEIGVHGAVRGQDRILQLALFMSHQLEKTTLHRNAGDAS